MVKQFEATMHDPYHIRLKDWRWIKCREVILQRDDRKCQVIGCGSVSNLCVHHKHYVQGKMPWDIPPEYLITVCSSCHEIIHETRESKEFVTKKSRREALYPLKKQFKNGIYCINPVEPLTVNEVPTLKDKTKKKQYKLAPVTGSVSLKALDNEQKKLAEEKNDKLDSWKKDLFKYKLRDRSLIYDNINFHNPQACLSFIKDGFAHYSGTLKRTGFLFKVPLSEVGDLFLSSYMNGRQLLKWLL